MPLVIPVGFATVALRWSIPTDPEEMVVTYGLANAELGDPTQIAASQANAWEFSFGAPGTQVPYVFRGATVRANNGGGGLVVGEVQVTNAGTVGTGQPLPNNCAFLVKKATARGGRSGRGRMYFPPFMDFEGDITPGGAIGAAFGAIQSALTAWKDAVPNMVLLHDSAIADTTPNLVTALTLDPRIATQRRRLR